MKKLEERRKFIRLEVPVGLSYFTDDNPVRKKVTTKNLSCEGLRFISDEEVKEDSSLELTLNIPGGANPVHISGNAVWVKTLSSQDNSHFEVGVEFTKIEEDNKNTFLKYLCDAIYLQSNKNKKNHKK